MSNKLLYDPKRLIKLQKNEILNEFRTRFSQEFYKTFKEAEKQIWNDQDQNFQFLEQIVISLQNELDEIQNALAQKVQAWSSVAEAEKKNSQNHKYWQFHSRPNLKSSTIHSTVKLLFERKRPCF